MSEDNESVVAVCVRGFIVDAETSTETGDIIELDPKQFKQWSDMDLVRVATKEDRKRNQKSDKDKTS